MKKACTILLAAAFLIVLVGGMVGTAIGLFEAREANAALAEMKRGGLHKSDPAAYARAFQDFLLGGMVAFVTTSRLMMSLTRRE